MKMEVVKYLVWQYEPQFDDNLFHNLFKRDLVYMYSFPKAAITQLNIGYLDFDRLKMEKKCLTICWSQLKKKSLTENKYR